MGEFESGFVANYTSPVFAVVSGGVGTILVVIAVAVFAVVLTEQGLAWVPRGLETLDWFYGRMTMGGAAEAAYFGVAAQGMSMTPSEYFARNVWVGASFLRATESAVRHEVGVDRIRAATAAVAPPPPPPPPPPAEPPAPPKPEKAPEKAKAKPDANT